MPSAATQVNPTPAELPKHDRPVHEIRMGSVKAAIWKQQSSDQTFFNVTFSRLYRDATQTWKSTDGFGRDELLVLRKVADRAHTWICEQAQNPKK